MYHLCRLMAAVFCVAPKCAVKGYTSSTLYFVVSNCKHCICASTTGSLNLLELLLYCALYSMIAAEAHSFALRMARAAY